MRVAVDGLNVCDDCASLVANGEVTGQEAARDITDAHAAKMVAKWGDQLRHMVLAGDSESSESEYECDGCGSTAWGSRHPAAILRP